MKLNRIKNQHYKLFKYNLLQLQIYSNKSSNCIINYSINILEQIQAHLKQVLNVIYKYHIFRFKILFISFPIVSKIKQTKLVHFTNHDFITEKLWISGFIRNRFSILTYLKLIRSQTLLKNFKLLLTIKKKPHLVVIFNPAVETSTINEFYKAGIPIIVFDWRGVDNWQTIYQAFGNYQFSKNNIKLTFFIILYSLLKKIPLKRNNIRNFKINKNK